MRHHTKNISITRAQKFPVMGKGGERTAPSDTLQFLWLNLEKKHWINDVEWKWWGEDRWLKKTITFQRRWLKRSSVFLKKRMWHPSVAAPGDTNPSDATGCYSHQSVRSLLLSGNNRVYIIFPKTLRYERPWMHWHRGA